MKNIAEYKGRKIHFFTKGEPGKPAVLLLHGYLESGLIWNDFTENLSDEYFLICPDLPGHGQSELYNGVHRMDELAEAMNSVVESLEIKKFHLIGHSMGGYVALAYRENYQDKLLSCVLFHSTCFADTPEKKVNRDREIKLILEGKKELIVNTNIPKAFADDNLEIMADKVEYAKKIALGNPDNGIISLLKGMRSRPERCTLFLDEKVPLLLIAGKKDNYIPFELMEKINNLGTNIELKVLENSGHMGFMEEPGKSAEILSTFFQKSFARI